MHLLRLGPSALYAHETEDESVGEEIEEMEYADLMTLKPGSDSEDSGSEFFELDTNVLLFKLP